MRTVLASMLLAALVAPSVSAQTRPAPRRPQRPVRPAPHPGSWEIGGGFVWSGGFSLGTQDADLTRNPTTGTGPFTEFTTENSLTSGYGLQAHLGYYFTRSVVFEAGARWTRPKVEVRATGDVEDAASQTATSNLNQFVFDGSLVYHFMKATFSRGKGIPYVSGGVGYIRDAHEDNQLIETGTEYHATAGFKYWFTPSIRARRLGLRAEGGFSIRDGGFDFEDKRRTVPIASVSVAYLF